MTAIERLRYKYFTQLISTVYTAQFKPNTNKLYPFKPQTKIKIDPPLYKTKLISLNRIKQRNKEFVYSLILRKSFETNNHLKFTVLFQLI